MDNVCSEIMERYKKVDTVANGIIKRTIRDLTDKNGTLAVINLSKYPYCGPIKIITEKKQIALRNCYVFEEQDHQFSELLTLNANNQTGEQCNCDDEQSAKCNTRLNLKPFKIGQHKGFTDEKLYNINQIPITEDYTTLYEYVIDVKNIPDM